MVFDQYLWLVIVGGFLSFFMSWGIGANDVANSFATAIGAKTLTLFQACCIAACLEFLGAMTLGGEVSNTIASAIAKAEVYKGASEVYAYGMLCSLLSASLWVLFASYKGYAVSTTHSIIGSVIGFTLVWKGNDSIIWYKPTNEFPFVKGLVPIIVSWFTSPIMSSILSAMIFLLNRHLILRRANSDKIAYYGLPPLVFLTIFVNAFFVLYKGAKAELSWGSDKAAWVSVIIAGGCSLLSGLVGIPYLRWKKEKQAILEIRAIGNNEDMLAISGSVDARDKNLLSVITITNSQKDNTNDVLNRAWDVLTYGVQKDKGIVENAHDVVGRHAEQFSNDTEHVYKFLQVFSSCCVAFAHGANDVANAIGPYAAILHVYENVSMSTVVVTPKWMLALGGAGIVIGLWTYGYNVIKSLGGQLCALSPSRGYSAELATALTVSFASVYGIPISTTHCIVGAEVGIGLVENLRDGVNWKLFLRTFVAWIFTLIVSGGLSALLFAQGVFSPSVPMLHDLNSYETGIKKILGDRNSSLLNDTKFIEIFAVDYIRPDVLVMYLNDSCHVVKPNIII